MNAKEFVENELIRENTLWRGMDNLSPQDWFILMERYYEYNLEFQSKCQNFTVDNTTSSATKCANCGKEVWEH